MPQNMHSNFVFVYGTLKRGEPNEHVMRDEGTGCSKFVGSARLLIKFPLIVSTRFNIPFLLDNPGVGKFVEGEIFEVDGQKLAALDELENHPHLYTRVKQEAEFLENGKKIQVFVYLLSQWKDTLVSSGSEMLVSYSNDGSHGRRYVERYLRDQMLERDKHTLINEVHDFT